MIAIIFKNFKLSSQLLVDALNSLSKCQTYASDVYIHLQNYDKHKKNGDIFAE